MWCSCSTEDEFTQEWEIETANVITNLKKARTLGKKIIADRQLRRRNLEDEDAIMDCIKNIDDNLSSVKRRAIQFLSPNLSLFKQRNHQIHLYNVQAEKQMYILQLQKEILQLKLERGLSTEETLTYSIGITEDLNNPTSSRIQEQNRIQVVVHKHQHDEIFQKQNDLITELKQNLKKYDSELSVLKTQIEDLEMKLLNDDDCEDTDESTEIHSENMNRLRRNLLAQYSLQAKERIKQKLKRKNKRPNRDNEENRLNEYRKQQKDKRRHSIEKSTNYEEIPEDLDSKESLENSPALQNNIKQKTKANKQLLQHKGNKKGKTKGKFKDVMQDNLQTLNAAEDYDVSRKQLTPENKKKLKHKQKIKQAANSEDQGLEMTPKKKDRKNDDDDELEIPPDITKIFTSEPESSFSGGHSSKGPVSKRTKKKEKTKVARHRNLPTTHDDQNETPEKEEQEEIQSGDGRRIQEAKRTKKKNKDKEGTKFNESDIESINSEDSLEVIQEKLHRRRVKRKNGGRSQTPNDYEMEDLSRRDRDSLIEEEIVKQGLSIMQDCFTMMCTNYSSNTQHDLGTVNSSMRNISNSGSMKVDKKEKKSGKFKKSNQKKNKALLNN